jgi:cytidylate kinase
MGEALERALRHWRSRGKGEPAVAARLPAPPAAPPWTVAISRQAGANGSAVAAAVGRRLGWPVYDRELVEMIAQEAGLRGRLVESVDERRAGWLQECWQAFTAQPSFGRLAYVRRLVRVLSSLAAHGECVIVGRGAAQVLPPATTLRARLVGPLEERVAVMRDRLGLGAEEARRRVQETDEQRAGFVRDCFHQDPDDPALYDLVLNSCRLGVDGCAELIAQALQRVRGGKVAAPAQPPAAAGQD